MDGTRVPLDDPEAEEIRKEAYWRRLDADGPPIDRARTIGEGADGWRWVVLADAADADFEAYHMRHSVGHSWGRYSAFGTIFGLRSPDGIPKATVLMAGNAAVHAREERNARLSPENEARLEAFAAAGGWTVRKDELPFEAFDGPGANTLVRFLVRDVSNRKTHGVAVMPGRPGAGAVVRAASSVGGARYDPDAMPDADAFRIEGAGGPHEIVSTMPTDAQPTTRADPDDFFEAFGRGSVPPVP